MRLIDASALEEKFAHPNETVYTFTVLDAIREQETVDPTRYGNWVNIKETDSNGFFHHHWKGSCSNCGNVTYWQTRIGDHSAYTYCPYCGAKMDIMAEVIERKKQMKLGTTCGGCRYNDGLCYTSDPPKYKCTINGEFHDGADNCCIEVEPIKHGFWKDENTIAASCSVCGKRSAKVINFGKSNDNELCYENTPYCHWCGARLDDAANENKAL